MGKYEGAVLPFQQVFMRVTRPLGTLYVLNFHFRMQPVHDPSSLTFVTCDCRICDVQTS